MCPICGNPLISQVNKVSGDLYYVCENYPACDYVSPMTSENAPQKIAR